jgi:anti-sigma regulatory factor (Ser/Thr protein kinase)
VRSERWLPVIADRFAGADHVRIDGLQARWERHLLMAIPEMSEARRIDVLLAAREAALNAMRHGCVASAAREATLQVCIRARSRLLRVTVEDPGPGHDFDLDRHEASAGDGMVDQHRGIALIHRLASAVTVGRNGARLLLDFRY